MGWDVTGLGYNKTARRWPCGLVVFGGDKRDRTADLLNAIQALSQLSYTPMYRKPLYFNGFRKF